MKDIKKFIKEFKIGTKTMFKEFFNKKTNKKQRANMLTFSRLIISFIIPILSVIASITGSIPILIAALISTAFGGITDFFDGRSARKHNSTSEYGKILDQVTDKIFALMIGISLTLFNPLFIINLLGESAISATNVIYKSKYKYLNIKSTKLGKIKEWPLFTTLGLGFLSTIFPHLNIITNKAIIVTFILQLATTNSYIKLNNEEIKKLIENKNIESTYEVPDNTYENTKVKEIKKENNTNSNTLSRQEQIINLRNVLNEIKDIKSNEEIDYQKQKKIN